MKGEKYNNMCNVNFSKKMRQLKVLNMLKTASCDYGTGRNGRT